MLISHIHRFIFIKLSKVGGTSTEAYFQPACQPEGLPVTHETRAYEGPEGAVAPRGRYDTGEDDLDLTEHMMPRQIKERFGTGLWNSYFKFTNVRNPFTAEVSRAKQRARAQGRALETLEAVMAEIRKNFEKRPNRRHFLVSNGACNIEAVIRFEALEEDVHSVADRIGFRTTEPLPHMNQRRALAEGANMAEFWANDLRDIVVEAHRPYFETFGYSTDPKDAHLVPPPPKYVSQKVAS